MDTFTFNLNKNQKYKKKKPECSVLYTTGNGPFTSGFGFIDTTLMRAFVHDPFIMKDYYGKGSEVLQSYNKRKTYDLLETEVYKIIIE